VSATSAAWQPAGSGNAEAQNPTLRLTEIFWSLQGETNRVGLPTVFIRLTGCPLRCGYCDTAYAFSGGRLWSFTEILAEVGRHAARYVTVTGGEPLAQRPCIDLLRRLCDLDYQVSLETSGAIAIADVDARVMKIVDIKTPGSGEVERNLITNLGYLQPKDQIKFVICDRNDYDWACTRLKEWQLNDRCEVLFSPSSDQLAPQTLADWILTDRLPVRFQIQLHKYLWGNTPGR
jgi:7-carboxy-7-deazaguanine synthase